MRNSVQCFGRDHLSVKCHWDTSGWLVADIVEARWMGFRISGDHVIIRTAKRRPGQLGYKAT